MDSFSRNGLTFDVTDSGTAEKGTFVLLHGFPQRRRSWDLVTPVLTGAGYRVLAPDQRGYAAGARPAGVAAYAIGELVADAAALVEAAGDGPVHLVGHDWGANVAWSAAAQRPELFRSVAGVSVPPMGAYLRAVKSSPRQLLHSWYVLGIQLPGVAERLTMRSPARFAAQIRAGGQTRERAEADVAAFEDPAALGLAMNWYRAARRDPKLGQGAITVPSLFVWSTGDVYVTSAAARMAGRFVDATYHSATLAGVSHWIPEEQPGQLAELLLEHAARN